MCVPGNLKVLIGGEVDMKVLLMTVKGKCACVQFCMVLLTLLPWTSDLLLVFGLVLPCAPHPSGSLAVL